MPRAKSGASGVGWGPTHSKNCRRRPPAKYMITSRNRSRAWGYRAFPFTVATAIAVWCATTQASSPKFFQATTQADFLKGDVENLSIDNRGQLVLGPATDLVYETASPFL